MCVSRHTIMKNKRFLHKSSHCEALDVQDPFQPIVRGALATVPFGRKSCLPLLCIKTEQLANFFMRLLSEHYIVIFRDCNDVQYIPDVVMTDNKRQMVNRCYPCTYPSSRPNENFERSIKEICQ